MDGVLCWPRRIFIDGHEVEEDKWLLDGWERYEGEWLNGERSGRGKKFGRNGKVVDAVWDRDLVVEVISKVGAKDKPS